jgi:hypothetical protein
MKSKYVLEQHPVVGLHTRAMPAGTVIFVSSGDRAILPTSFFNNVSDGDAALTSTVCN